MFCQPLIKKRVELLFFPCPVYVFSSLIFSTLFQSHAKCILVLIFGLVCYLLQICEMQILVVSSVIYNCSCIVVDTIFHVFECSCLDRISAGSPLCWKYHLCFSLFSPLFRHCFSYTFKWQWMINNTFDSIW